LDEVSFNQKTYASRCYLPVHIGLGDRLEGSGAQEVSLGSSLFGFLESYHRRVSAVKESFE
jgi:hypothetical protein